MTSGGPSVEVNFDGLVGPTHNYAGLSRGNLASLRSAEASSNPRAAALQGLAKMRRLLELGFPQGLLPPHERPSVRALRALGFRGTDAAVLEAAGREAPLLLRNAASASAMWTANAATISPSADSQDGRVHCTPANLTTMLHRAWEASFTRRCLQQVFGGPAFRVHEPIPAGGGLGDEGAANHGRLCAEHGTPGLQLFIYGRAALGRDATEHLRQPARQAREASEAVARQHRLRQGRVFFLRQARAAVEAGAFHNDVVAVANGPVLLYHEQAFDEPPATFEAIRRAAADLAFEPIFIPVPASAVSLEDAVRSYLFNSQLLTRRDGSMLLLLPLEACELAPTRVQIQELVGAPGPITDAVYLDLRQSMANGGGPACLRLRVVLTPDELAAVAPGFLLNGERIDRLEAWVQRHYRDRLVAADLADPRLLDECRAALDALTQLLGVGPLYDFQRSSAEPC